MPDCTHNANKQTKQPQTCFSPATNSKTNNTDITAAFKGQLQFYSSTSVNECREKDPSEEEESETQQPFRHMKLAWRKLRDGGSYLRRKFIRK